MIPRIGLNGKIGLMKLKQSWCSVWRDKVNCFVFPFLSFSRNLHGPLMIMQVGIQTAPTCICYLISEYFNLILTFHYRHSFLCCRKHLNSKGRLKIPTVLMAD